MTPHNDQGPLSHLTVLDLSRLLPGGYATFLLAALGARVIKVEEPGSGDYIRWTPPMHGELSSGHIALNRGKESITLNLKEPGATEVLERLAAQADVLVESFRPGVLDRLGVGWERIHELNPALVWCAITGYGQSGPYRDLAGHDVDYLAYAGVLDLTGVAGEPAAIPGVQIADLGGGALMALVGILAALTERGRTGKGAFVDTSMTDGAFSMAALAMHSTSAGYSWARGGGPISGGLACYRVYSCADGRELAVGALEPKFFARLCAALELPELVEKQLIPDAQPALIATLSEKFALKSRDEWVSILEPLEACVAPVNSLGEAVKDPQIVAREMIRELATPAGPFGVAASPIRIVPEPGAQSPQTAATSAPPGLGAHTESVLLSTGYTSEEVADLRKRGVI